MPSRHSPAPLDPCDVFSEEIHLLVDGELGPAETAVVEEHLQGCARCLALAAHLERMSSVLKAWDQYENDMPAPELRIKHMVLARVAEQGAKRRRDDRFVRVLHVATAAVVILGLGLGVVLGLAAHEAPATAPAVELSDLPSPLVDRAHVPLDLSRGPFEDPLTAGDLLAGVTPPVFSDVTPGGEAPWDERLFGERTRDGIPQLVARFQRQEAFEDIFGERAMYWTGPRAQGAPRLVTESVYRFLAERKWLRDWRDRSTKTSPTVPTRPDPAAANLSTGMTARDLAKPMPGIQQPLRLKPESRLAGVLAGSVAAKSGRARSAKSKAVQRPVLEAWAVRDDVPGVPGLKSGPLATPRQAVLDPLVAWGNEQLRFAESPHDAGMVVAFVSGTTKPIFLPAGQFIHGGLGARVVAHPTWLPASRGTATHPIRCYVVQGMPHAAARGAPQLSNHVAGPTIRSLLAAGASQADVKAAARRIVEVWLEAFGATLDPWQWSLLSFYERNAGPAVAAAHERIRWGDAAGFLATDGLGHLVGFELVRVGTAASRRALLKRLWLGYVAEASWRVQSAAARAAFVAPTDYAAKALSRLAEHAAHFRIPAGASAVHGARVSHLEVEAAGLRLHALEVRREAATPWSPAVVSGLGR